MKKKIIGSFVVALIIVATTFFTALATMPNGTVVIGDKSFDLAYANDTINLTEITKAIIQGGEVYVKDFSGNWIDNNTGLKVNASVIPGEGTLIPDSGMEFLNGPYLLAPKTDSMIVAWESTKNVQAKISYGLDANNLNTIITVSPDKDAPIFQGSKKNLYHVKLDKLKESKLGTKYYYKVELSGGQKYKASFTTLGTSPSEIKVMSLSDSHVFSTRAAFDEAVKAYQPAFIIHCGDLVEGTGVQAEQFSFWFKGDEDDFIHSYPVVYAGGNHDQGGDYANSYIFNVQDAEYGGTVSGNSSFNYAGIHVTLMNSNPWGLYQMNSEATGNTAEASTIKTIEDSLAWLKKDLALDAAKNADFRILAMHHPKSDAYTNKYIPKIAEEGNVDLMLSGHTHSYLRAVSDNPAVGAGTVYLTHQDARVHNKKGDYMAIEMDPVSELLTCKNYGRETATSSVSLANTTVIAKNKQQLTYSDISITPTEILSNGQVTISATVKNNGKGIAAAVIPVMDNETTRYIYKFDNAVKILEPGASASLKGTISISELGKHVLKLSGTSVDVNVLFRKATFDYKNIRTKLGDEKVSNINSNKLSIKADITNIGNEAGTDEAKLIIDGKVIETKTYSLIAGGVKTAEFVYTFANAGEYQVSIGNAAPQTIYIEGSIQGMPIARDKSGNGNDAYIHGAPELGTDLKGQQTIIFDGKRDYIEIPDTGKYTVSNAATGMVWANLPSSGTKLGGVTELTEAYTDGKGVVNDHNPLMVKGIGLGWGTPYLFRMAIRETGKVTYGVCFYDDNGEFSWNDGSDSKAGIKKDTWVQYTSAFDFSTGADSYQNGYLSAHVDKPVFGDAPVKNYEGVPMYIGLGFKNTLLTKRNRGMYHTMLPGAISQVRFYTSKVSSNENDAIRENPTAANVSADGLKVWLDFNNENLITTGTHTTEWTAITDAPKALDYRATFSGKAKILVKIQTSNDGSAVKEEKDYILDSGNNTLDLSQLRNAKYARVITTFVSDLNTTNSSIPVLHEYVLKSGNEKRWNTSVDWMSGTFENAAGHQSSDLYRDHAKDFDDYSGTASTPN